MRIFYAADTTPNANFVSNLWRDNLFLPLVDLGHDVVEFDFDLREVFKNLDPADRDQRQYIMRQRPRTSRELMRQVRRAHTAKPLDLFFSYFYDACVLPETIEEIRSMGITTVNWFCNASYQIHLVSEIAPHYDWCLVPEKFRLADYEALGARPLYCQLAANPSVYRSFDEVRYEFDVTFVGQAYGDRPEFIEHLLGRGVDVKVWGPGWERFTQPSEGKPRVHPWARGLSLGRKLLTRQGWLLAGRRLGQLAGHASSGRPSDRATARLPASIAGGTLSDVEMIRMYSRSRINLGFSTCGETHRTGDRIVQVRLRDFEVPMSGGFYMVEYMEELEEFFDIGKEIVCYRDKGDLAEKIQYYLAHDSEREAIRVAGHRRARKDHSWQQRFRSVFDRIEVGAGSL